MRLNEVNLNGNSELTFRFRNVNKMLEYKELENLEMYFCPFDMEDDVLEGSLNLYWKADEILWDNFIGHYFLVFYTQYIILILSDGEERKIPEKINWRLFGSDFNMDGLIQELLDKPIVKLIKTMAMNKEHKVGNDELRFYLNLLHNSVIEIVGRINGASVFASKDREDEIDYTKIEADTNWDEAKERGFFRILDQLLQSQKKKIDLQRLPDWQRWLLLEFPNNYFDVLGEMVFPKWYIVSFCKNCTNTRNWAQYGDSNKGVCLLYRTHQGSLGRGLRLKTCHEYSTSKGKIFNNHIEPLLNVEYSAKHPELNFFEMLGNLPGKMVDEWFHDSKGNASTYYIKHDNGPEWQRWHREYWELFQKIVVHKGEDWEGLAEERIILENSVLIDYEYEPSERKIKYDFDELRGIIWGCNVKEAQKDKIRSIIKELCANTGRTDFEFYQAVKDPSSHEIWIEKEIL
jgi:hypothetical protein